MTGSQPVAEPYQEGGKGCAGNAGRGSPPGDGARVRCRHLVEVTAVSREDVVLQRPEDVRFLVEVFHTPSACPGAATAYLLRRIAYRAGAYAPGIQEQIFHELNTTREGGTIEKVQHWFTGRVASLHELGYRLQCRRVATPTSAILDWVRAGRGYRGAMLPASYKRLHLALDPASNQIIDDNAPYAVGITIDRLDAKADEELVMIDPWPGVGRPDRGKLPPALDAAHRDKSFHALVYYWVGWS